MKAQYRILSMLMLLLGSVSAAMAANKFYVEPTLVEAGKRATLNFQLDNEDVFYGFQTEVSLPSGLTMKSYSLVDSRTDNSFDILSNIDNGKILLASFSNTHSPITGHSGTLLKMEVEVAEDFSGGTIKLTNSIFVSPDNKDVRVPDSTTQIGLYIPVRNISLSQSLAELYVGDDITLTATVFPENATDKTVTWTSSNPAIANVDDNGHVTAIAPGEVIITVSCGDFSATCVVRVSSRIIPATGILLDKEKEQLTVGETTTITATVLPEDATDKTVTWTSSDESIAYVDRNGTVTAVAPGEVTITATCGNVYASCIVTVNPKIIPTTGIYLNKEKIQLTVGEITNIIATVLPDDATDKTITWTSSDETIATVDANGKVTAIAPGEATITASCGGNSASCLVTVVQRIIPAIGISLNKDHEELIVGDTSTLLATVTPEDATDKTVNWTSSDNSIAFVDGNGTVTAVATGEVTITAACGNVSATCIITVSPKIIPAISISLDKEKEQLTVGKTTKIIATVLPEDATDKTITWTSSDPSIATVDSEGNVVAIALGEAIITASCGSATASCHVTVVPTLAESITLNPTSAELRVGETVELTPTILPETTTDKSVKWSSNNESIATVDDHGVVTAVGLGITSITATCGNIYTSCMVTVVPTPASGITLSIPSAQLHVGESITITGTVLPESTSDPTIVWVSSDDKIASIDANGKITAYALGEVTIKAICGDATATCVVTVVPTPTERIELDPASAEIKVSETILIFASIFPDNATDKNIIWTTSDQNIATVDANGNVTGVAIGEALVTATCSGVSASCNVKVVPVPVSSITLTNTELTMIVGETSEIDAIAHPSDAEVETIIWTSDNESIAKVDSKGIVTAVSVGNAVITATYIADPSIKAECKVTVKSNIIVVNEIIISDKSLEMIVDDKYTLTATVKPENASDQSLSWRSSDWSVAVVSENGEVTATGVGSAIIYVSSSNGLTAECAVTVKERIIDPTGITLSNSELLMREGYTSDLIAIVRPDNATDKSVTWTTSDPNIATVDNNGIVTAIKQGNAVITATTTNGFKAECYVTVVPVVIPIENITISDTSLVLNINETYTLIATITPEDATDKSVTWKSADPSIATVSEYGVVTGISAGTTTVYASSSNGLTVECLVTVLPGEIEVTGISLSNTELLMREGYTTDLIAIVRPENASDKTVFWSTSDPAIATVDENGIVTAIKAGVCVITATSAYGQQATCTVTVVPVVITVDGITINKTSVEISVDETYQLIASVMPENATDKSITWRSSDPAIATVDNNGLVRGISAGTITVYASSSNGITAECIVTVIPQEIEVTGISLSNTELLMIEGESTEIKAIVRPADATDKTIIWTSSDETIATVDENGVINAIRPGNATITATAENGINANCAVTVVPRVIAVESILISDKSLELNIDDTYTLTATIIPENATDKTLTWKSSDSSIVTVTENGEVTAISAGTATIYVSSSNGLTAECIVTVLPGIVPVISISLSNTELLMREGYNSELIAIVHPDDATDKRVVWSTDNESVATVDNNGNVTANGVGTAIITVTSVFDPSIKNQCVVTVEKENQIIAVTEIKLSDSELTLTEGDIYTLIATITPEDATDKTVTWKSSDTSIAIVSENGEVTAVKAGTAIIYASSSNGLTAECKVTVLPAIVEPTSITLTNTELLMREGYSTDLIAIVGPENATDKSVTWKSSDESIATVDENGIVTAIKPGVTIITASTSNGIEAYCTVTVIPVVIPVESITLNRTYLEMEIDDTFGLIATVLPEDATDKTVTWKSSDKAIATVSDDGVVTAISAGTTTILASSSNGLTAECVVTVNPGEIEVTGISLTNTELLMIEGDISDLIAIVHPDNATDKSVVWSSSDESIATVDENGIVTAIKTGYATITATASNGSKAECFVTVLPLIKAVESITISDSELELIVGDNYQLTATITPEDATDKTITWKSSDRAIATVSDNGLVTAVEVGTAIIYASTSNGLTAECHVTVKPGIIEVGNIALTNTELLIIEGDVAELYAIVLPDNATDKSITWASTNPEIATVDDKGTVTAILQGKTDISATASNGVKAICHVTVVPLIKAVEEISISKRKLTLIEGDSYQLTATVTPEDATDKTVTWKSSDRSVATVSDDGVVDAIKVGVATIYVSSSNGLTVECEVTVLPRIIEVTNISVNPTSLILSEGETASLIATVTPDDATDKTIIWTSLNPDIAKVENGIVTGITKGTTTIIVKSSNGLTATCTVTVYPRPVTPKQLLRKGDGTTCTFVVLMGIPDDKLTELGYKYVFGYTDSEGEYHVISETPLRYCHTSSEIYNDPTNDFWVFTLLENEDGVLLNSDLRHLDGREEICYDASKFGYGTKGSSDVASIEFEDMVKVSPSALHIKADRPGNMFVAIYSMNGAMVFSKYYHGETGVDDIVDFNRFTPDTYVVTVSVGSKVISKKIVVR